MVDRDDTPIIPLSAVRGQTRVIERLARELSQGRVHHAHLFAGPDGVGKSLVARAFAQRLLCPAAQGMDACGHCASCLKVETGNHPDWLWVAPDGASIKIQQARDIAAATRYRPNEGERRVIVIEQVETMGLAAANALLKTIEEPSGQTVFVLMTSALNLLLPTIRSRCAIVPFAPLPLPITEDILRAHDIDEAHVATLARLSQGSPGYALAIAEQMTWDERDEEVQELLRMAKGDRFSGLRFASEIASQVDRATLDARLVSWLWIMRDVAVVQSTNQGDLVYNQDQQRGIKTLAGTLGAPRLFEWIRALERARARIKGNVNHRLILESLVLEFEQSHV